MSSYQPEQLPLGKQVPYISTYTPGLLFPIPRQIKRAEIGVPSKLPFFGADIWNSYELSWLNAKGKPQVALAEFTVPCTSPNLIESKSFKLYLNSLNQTRFDSPDKLEATLQKDLSKAAGAPLGIKLILPSQFAQQILAEPSGQCIDDLDVEVAVYDVMPGVLRVSDEVVEEVLYSNLLKSNCLVTGQPDWASLWISYTGPKIEHESLLKYIISFREHNEFHEQCIERIFMDLLARCKPQKLSVYGRYTRRGGLDINPFRSNHLHTAPNNLRHCRQ